MARRRAITQRHSRALRKDPRGPRSGSRRQTWCRRGLGVVHSGAVMRTRMPPLVPPAGMDRASRGRSSVASAIPAHRRGHRPERRWRSVAPPHLPFQHSGCGRRCGGRVIDRSLHDGFEKLAGLGDGRGYPLSAPSARCARGAVICFRSAPSPHACRGRRRTGGSPDRWWAEVASLKAKLKLSSNSRRLPRHSRIIMSPIIESPGRANGISV